MTSKLKETKATKVVCNYCSTPLKYASSMMAHQKTQKCQIAQQQKHQRGQETILKTKPKASMTKGVVQTTTTKVLQGMGLLNPPTSFNTKTATKTQMSSLNKKKDQKTKSSSTFANAKQKIPLEDGFQNPPSMFRQSVGVNVQEEHEDEENEEVEIDQDFQDSSDILKMQMKKKNRKSQTQKTSQKFENLEEDREEEEEEEEGEEEENQREKEENEEQQDEQEEEEGEEELKYDEENEGEQAAGEGDGDVFQLDPNRLVSKQELRTFQEIFYTLYYQQVNKEHGLGIIEAIREEIRDYKNTTFSDEDVEEKMQILDNFVSAWDHCILNFWSDFQKGYLNFAAAKEVKNVEEQRALNIIHDWWTYKHLVLGSKREKKLFSTWIQKENEFIEKGKSTGHGMPIATFSDATLAISWLNHKFTKLREVVSYFLRHSVPLRRDSTFQIPKKDTRTQADGLLKQDMAGGRLPLRG